MAVENVGELNPEVEIWLDKRKYYIHKIYQSQIAPDTCITIGEKILDLEEEQGVECNR